MVRGKEDHRILIQPLFLQLRHQAAQVLVQAGALSQVVRILLGGPFKGGAAVEELVSTASLPKTILALAGVDVGGAMIGENLLLLENLFSSM